ncbi:MAG: DEAD/DEAH box helicase, partial [Bdellovibrionota bacterium]
MALKFTDLDLHPSLMAGITKQGFEDTTPIQELTMPHVLEGKDVAGLAQTGTGKTAAVLLPIMERIVRSRLNPDQLSPEEKEVRDARGFPEWRANQFILVLVPTRELCEQVYESAVKLAAESGLRAASIYGGVAYEKQKEALRNGVEFIIATPGRLIDLYKENLVDLKQVRAIIFDEADRMF